MQASIARICTSFIDIPGKISIAIFFAGCSIRCKGCQNKELWERASVTIMSLDNVLQKIDTHPLADSIVFLGGEPTDQCTFLEQLCIKSVSKYKALYTGREFEALPTSLIDHLDMIVCGPYVQELSTNTWPASSNQRILKRENNLWIPHNT